jgi:hypothetical protein
LNAGSPIASGRSRVPGFFVLGTAPPGARRIALAYVRNCAR